MRLKTMGKPRFIDGLQDEMLAAIKAARDDDLEIECIYITRDEAYTMMQIMKQQGSWMKGQTLDSVKAGHVEMRFSDVRLVME